MYFQFHGTNVIHDKVFEIDVENDLINDVIDVLFVSTGNGSFPSHKDITISALQ